MLPTPAQILVALKRSGDATPRSLAALLGVTKKEMTEFRRLVRELKREQAVVGGGRSHLRVPQPKMLGEFLDTTRGFGFVRPAARGADIFIPKWQRSGARDGDTVEFEITQPQRGAGRVVRVVERLPSILGIVSRRGSGFSVLPFRKTMEEIEITSHPRGLKADDIVRVELDHARGQRTGRVVDVLGDFDTEGIEEHVILESHKRPTDFSAEALEEAASFDERLTTAEVRSRKDFRDLLCFTIDPDDAKDFDDAISLQPSPSGTTQILGVHIADVSHYVTIGSALDADARSRGCSVYFPRGVVPMLPLHLSADLCSLRPGVERPAFSVMMEVNAQGQVVGSEFHTSVIRSGARLTYTEAQEMLDGPSRSDRPQIRQALTAMKDLAARMFELRCRDGSLDFDLPEPLLHFDTSGDLVHISPYPRLATHRIVEEFMLAANEAVARHLFSRRIPTLHRIHEPPETEKVEELNEVLEVFRLPVVAVPDPQPRDFQRAIEQAQRRPEEKFLTFKILRTLMLARYSPESLGHFGLAKAFYLHFTSPIRRYPDLVAHRALRAAIGSGAAATGNDLDLLADTTSRLERDAAEIENEIVAWKVARFMRKRLGETYSATVIGFSAHHIIVELEGLYVEGKVRLDSLLGRWELDRRSWSLKCGKKRIKIADRMNVQVVAVDLRRREAIFMIAAK